MAGRSKLLRLILEETRLLLLSRWREVLRQLIEEAARMRVGRLEQ